jgi:uncharacterized repeat protein (TIGR01451 family)
MRTIFPACLLLLGLMCGAFSGAAQGPTVFAPPAFQWVDGLYSPRLQLTGGVGVHTATLDHAGNVYATVNYGDSVMIGGQPYAAPIDSSLGISRWALVKYNPTGQVLWKKPCLNTSPSGGLRTDAAGNLYCYGGLSYPFMLDSVAVNMELGMYPLTKWSPAGDLLWMQQMGLATPGARNYALLPTAMRLDPAGDVLFSGWYWDSAQVGPFTLAQSVLTNGRGSKVATAFGKLNGQTGAVQWAVSTFNKDTASSNTATNIGTDAAGNYYLIGTYTGTIQLGAFTTPATAANMWRTYWAKFDASGQCVLLRTFESSSNSGTDRARTVVGSDGFSYITSSFERPINFGGVTLTPAPGTRDAFIARLDPNGVLQQVVQLSSQLGNATLLRPMSITLDHLGHVYISGGRTLPTDPNGQQAFLATFEQRDLTKKLWELEGGGTGTDIGGTVTVNPSGQVSWAGNCISEFATFGSFQFGLAGSTDPHYQKGFVAKIAPSFNLLQGAVFVDANTNGTRDAGETAYNGSSPIVALTPGSLVATTDATGQYTAQVGQGTYSAALPNPPRYYTAAPIGATTVTFNSFGQVAGPSFALQPIPNQQDVQVVLTLVSPARPGNLLNYYVQYRNTGTASIAAGDIALTYDGRLQFHSSTLPPTTSVGSVMTWHYTALRPGETRRFSAAFRLPVTAVLGTLVSSTATINPLVGDLEPLDNTSSAERIVTGSYDPNDIQVNHLLLNTTQVANGEWLEYTIRFQNHGTDTAFTVMLIDSLPAALLRLSTVQIIAASHNCNWGVSPQGTLMLEFPSIMLPAQLTNQIASDGFVRFRVQPATALVGGDEIPNQARIHFDYNAPLTTNTVRTTIEQVTGLVANSGRTVVATVWPNPAAGTLNVEFTSPATDPLTLTLVDALGQAVLTHLTAHSSTHATLDLRGLAAGVYVLRGQGTGQPFTRRVVVR